MTRPYSSARSVVVPGRARTDLAEPDQQIHRIRLRCVAGEAQPGEELPSLTESIAAKGADALERRGYLFGFSARGSTHELCPLGKRKNRRQTMGNDIVHLTSRAEPFLLDRNCPLSPRSIALSDQLRQSCTTTLRTRSAERQAVGSQFTDPVMRTV